MRRCSSVSLDAQCRQLSVCAIFTVKTLIRGNYFMDDSIPHNSHGLQHWRITQVFPCSSPVCVWPYFLDTHLRLAYRSLHTCEVQCVQEPLIGCGVSEFPLGVTYADSISYRWRYSSVFGVLLSYGGFFVFPCSPHFNPIGRKGALSHSLLSHPVEQQGRVD